MKHFLLSLLSLFLLSLALAAVLGGLAVKYYLAQGPLSENRIVLVERGNGVGDIAEKLKSENVIANQLLFKIAARMGKTLKAGEYEFAASVPMAEVIRMMQEGEVYDRKITIPEGYTSYQVVELLNARQDLEGQITSIPAEGSLLPDTYHFVSGESRADIIARMQKGMTTALDTLWAARQPDLPVQTKEQALTLASIVEKETGVPEERTRVAGVFVNRLKKNMPLQTDPTVIYALTKGKIQNKGQGPLGRRLLTKDLEVDSPYNTYKYGGLPPGPIANPGLDSLKATLNPEQHDYIYFVADGKGGHVFASTLAEHNQNVANWRKIRSTQ